jgi:NAD+ synthase (glutamine-hydrolysing)
MTTPRYVRVAAAALQTTPLDWRGNTARILAAIAEARGRGASVLCLPELCVSGYGCEDAFHAPFVLERAAEQTARIAEATAGMVVSVGLPVAVQKAVFNAVALLVDGRVAALVAKRSLAGDGIHYEPRWFKPWPEDVRAEVELPGAGPVPIGDLLVDVGGVRIGFEICEDAWVPHRPGADLAVRGVDLLLNASASHFAFGKQATRERFVLEGARAFGCAYVYSNLLGNEAGRVIYDGGAMIAADGKLLARGPRFSYRDHEVTDAVVDVVLARTRQAVVVGTQPDLVAGQRDTVAVPFAWPDLRPAAPVTPARAAWEGTAHEKEEEFDRAIALGLFDYLRKSRSRGVVVSLSGGADSATVAVLVHDMVRHAFAQLGEREARARLGLGAPPSGPGDLPERARATVRELLLTLYQPTRNSGPVTRDAARAVAEGVGAEHHVVDVEEPLAAYLERGERALGRRLDWSTDDLALQNVQARVRGPSAWLLANVRGALLVSTSNRSEAAVGYATMDGDTCGGLSPLAGVDKAFIRQWLRWREAEGPEGIGPLPCLRAVNAQQPTAELRPPGSEQTDEGDLMPYELLEAIEEAFIRDRLGPVECFERARVVFEGRWDRARLGAWVERFFVLFARNQWKRERYALSFHVDDASLDPKTWCRFPVLSGAFEEEIGALRAHVAALG